MYNHYHCVNEIVLGITRNREKLQIVTVSDSRNLSCFPTQKCVRERACRSILAVRKVSRETAMKAVDDVFDSCFNDHEPFGRVPHNKSDAKYAYRDFQNRNRFYTNL